MVIVWGRKLAGYVGAVHGHHAATRYFHLFWLPLFPIGFVWITGRNAEGLIEGHPARVSWRSLAAGYLRWWGSLAALSVVGGVVLWHPTQMLATAPLTALMLLSWSWRRVRSPAELRERELFEAAVGTYCDPDLLIMPMVRELRRQLEQTWGQKWPSLSPQDVARRGATDPAQVAGAYALLRLSAREAGGDKRRELTALARKLATREKAAMSAGAGPYRKSTFGAI